MSTSKKLIIAVVILGVLVGFAALIFPLLGRPGHIHEYTDNIKYTVEDDTAFYSNKCKHCDKYGPEKVLENSIVVTPESVQSVLDTNINGKTIVFGAYEFKDLLELRPSRTDSTTRIYAWESDTTYDDSYVLALNELVKDSLFRYHYTRTIENVNFVGVEGTSIQNHIFVRSGETFYYSDTSYNGGYYYDAVRLIDYSQEESGGKHASHITINNITFENLSFEGSNGLIYMDNVYEDSSLANMTVRNCSFKTDSPHTYRAATHLGCAHRGNIKNITFANNFVSGHYQGIRLDSFDSATVANNTFEKIFHNAVGLYGNNGEEQYFTGTVSVRGNTINDGQNRAIKLYKGIDAIIIVENNKIANFSNDSGEVIQLGMLTGESKYSIFNNSYKSTTLTEYFEQSADVMITY